MDTDTNNVTFKPRSGKAAHLPVQPEVEVYIHLLVLIFLLDSKLYQEVGSCVVVDSLSWKCCTMPIVVPLEMSEILYFSSVSLFLV